MKFNLENDKKIDHILLIFIMCGIVGYIGKDSATQILLDGLKRLEYRGYDSAGIAMLDNNSFSVVREPGRIDALRKKISLSPLEGTIGIDRKSVV